jgi:hypothetical protein
MPQFANNRQTAPPRVRPNETQQPLEVACDAITR